MKPLTPRAIKVSDLEPGHRFELAGYRYEILEIEPNLYGDRIIRFGPIHSVVESSATLVLDPNSDFEILLNI